MSRFASAALLVASLILIQAAPARAQATNLAERLPADTIFYVYWRGGDSISPASRNALVALWNDPGFAPARTLIENKLDASLGSNHKLGNFSPQEARALLDQPMIFGARMAKPDPSNKTGSKFPIHAFLVVQGSGKAGRDLLSGLALNGPSAASDIKLTPAGYLVASSDPGTRSELAARFTRAPAASSSLASVGAYRETQARFTRRPTLEFFFRFPDLSTFPSSAAANFNTVAFLRALHYDRLHLAFGEVDLNTPREFARFSLLGDTSPGGPFDLFGESSPSFESLAAAPAGSSLTAFRIDLGAFVSDIMNALSAAEDPAQAAKLNAEVGIFTGAVLPAFAGEYAVISLPPSDDASPPSSLFATTVHPQAVQQLFALLLASFVHGVGQEGQTYYYRTSPIPSFGVSPSQTPGKNSSGARKGGIFNASASCPYFIAVTPQLLVAGKDEAIVRATAHSLTGAAPTSPGLAAEPNFLAARAEMPAQLTGLAFTDFTQVHWADSLKPIETASENDKQSGIANDVAAFNAWLKSGGSAVLARHLHWLVIGSWKDPRGMHWRADIN